jgi:predicted glutamine amidotransferase
MCRVFGFKSVIQSQVHHSLVNAENALGLQSQQHPDGWGVAYYHHGAPHVIKSERTAIDDQLFKKVSGIVSSETVVAHIRNATQGTKSILNTHPFQYGPWVFAHNGNIKNWESKKEELLNLLSPKLKRFVLGETDSEFLFYLILTHLDSFSGQLVQTSLAQLVKATQAAIKELIPIIGEISPIDNGGNTENYLTFIITDGQRMLAHHGGKNLNYSTHKSLCPERKTCPSFSKSCESPSQLGERVNHLIFSSEPLSGKNIWNPMKPGQIIGVDAQMKLHFYTS